MQHPQATAALIAAGRYLHERGWVPATSGNLSARLDDGSIAITASGRHKGQLTDGDILRVDAEGRSLDARRPSAETALHLGLYRRYTGVGAVLHPHSPASILASRLFPDGLRLEGHELQKALRGVTTHEARVDVPVFANDQDIARLAARIDEYLAAHDTVHGYIIQGHGFYSWGESVEEALRHVEALEFLFDLEVRLMGAMKR